MKRLTILCATFLALLVSLSPASPADTSAGINVSRGKEDSMAYSLNVMQKYESWIDNENLTLGPLAEIGAHAWVPDHDDTIFGGFLAPGLRLALNTNAQIQPYLEGSVGGALNSKRKIDRLDLGSHALFRSRGTVGLSFGDELRHRIQGDYVHYSTMGLTKENDGYDTYGVSYGYNF
ncbi:MAG: acyloxyacyl hydrolase [Desulfovibrio sp.]|jgi:hypothetical protein|nr:acyloxyacyl hydrolase [Desulfovibrio sp.]